METPARLRGCAFGKASADLLQGLLAEYGAGVSGTKEVLRKRLAGVAVKAYGKHRAEMERYFKRQRYIRTGKAPLKAEVFPVLEHAGSLRNLLTAMYVQRHLRASAILDSEYVDETYDDESLALALVEGRLSVGGGFLRAG